MAAFLALLFLAVMLIFFLEIAGKWQVYRKMGIKPWKCLIPYYSTYVAYHAVWTVQFFWIWLALELLSAFLPSPFSPEASLFVRMVSLLVIGLLTVWNAVFYYQISIAFGERIAFAVGLFFVPWIFYPLLGFSSQYQFRGNRHLPS